MSPRLLGNDFALAAARRHSKLLTVILASCMECVLIASEAVKPPTTDDQQTKLLAESEKKLGPMFPGKDPAFLILPRQSERGQVAQDLLTAEARQTREKALAYLLRTQNADGSWSEKNYPRNTGVTALCCLALMSAGNTPRVGAHGKALDKGIEFLLKTASAQESGIIAGDGSNAFGPMYEHAYSTLALVYAYGSTPWQPGMRNTISKAIQAIGNSQRQDGGWRYAFTKEGASDISATTVVLWALRSAKKSGLTINSEVIKKGVKFIESCAQPDGTFRYRAFGLYATPSLGGAAIVALSNAGNLNHVLIPPARDRIAYDYRRYDVEDLKTRRYFVYGAFHASLAMYTFGDERWVPFYKKTAVVLRTLQDKDGSWSDDHGNTTYTTAMALMIFQAPYGYLPLYER